MAAMSGTLPASVSGRLRRNTSSSLTRCGASMPTARTRFTTRAILSRFPIVRWDNQDVSTHRLEKRGLLHCEIQLPRWKEPLHCVCVHLGLLARWRGRQLELLRQRIERLVPPTAPLIVAGDFNDWRYRVAQELAQPLTMHEVFELVRGVPARSFPAVLPLMALDRIYLRGFQVRHAHVHHGRAWARISDHAALAATLVRS